MAMVNLTRNREGNKYPTRLRILAALKDKKLKSGYAIGKIIGNFSACRDGLYPSLDDLVNKGLIEVYDGQYRITSKGSEQLKSVTDNLI